jgi:hypothetical protein
MRQIRKGCWLLLCVLSIGPVAFAQDQPKQLSVCELKTDPAAHNHELVEVTAFVSHGFEDFTLFDPTCPSWPAVWLEYGGTSKSGTMYCCGVTADRHRPKQLVVEGISIPLIENDTFHEFDKLIQPPFRSDRHGAIAHATIVGRFFAGREMRYPKGTCWGGYGHMGCCSLLAIQEVKSVNSQDRDDLDYGASPDQPDIDKKGCGYRILTPLEPASDLIKTQEHADLGQSDWVFDDPKRVATDAIAQFIGRDSGSIAELTQKRKGRGRAVYEWKPAENKQEAYMVVVSRPYWLSFYSRDPARVAWVVIAAYVSSCGKGTAVTRIS